MRAGSPAGRSDRSIRGERRAPSRHQHRRRRFLTVRAGHVDDLTPHAVRRLVAPARRSSGGGNRPAPSREPGAGRHRGERFHQAERREAVAAAPGGGTVGRVIEKAARLLQPRGVLDQETRRPCRGRARALAGRRTGEDGGRHEHVVRPALAVLRHAGRLLRGGERGRPARRAPAQRPARIRPVRPRAPRRSSSRRRPSAACDRRTVASRRAIHGRSARRPSRAATRRS